MYPTTNVLRRTFQLRYGEAEGTCFTVDRNNRQYIVTAKHLVQKIYTSTTIEIRHDESWKNCEVKLVGHCGQQIDISVLAADFPLSPTHPLGMNPADIILGQEVFFLGFPYGLNTNMGEPNRNFPIPFVKKAILSAMDTKLDLLYLDGHNNPGFSGGPVVFSQGQDPANAFSVAGVISGYRASTQPVVSRAGEPTPFEAQYNTGIICAYGIKHVLHLIDQNPIGFDLNNAQIA